MPIEIHLPSQCDGCHKPLAKMLVCSTCKTSAYCSSECQNQHWPVHKFGCSKLPANLPVAEIANTPALRAEAERVWQAVAAASESWMDAGLLVGGFGIIGNQTGWQNPNRALTEPQRQHAMLSTPEFKRLTALRVPSEFDYPSYGGHKAGSKYIFNHHLVLIICLTLPHALSTMDTRAKAHLCAFLDPTSPARAGARRIASGGGIAGIDFAPKGAPGSCRARCSRCQAS